MRSPDFGCDGGSAVRFRFRFRLQIEGPSGSRLRVQIILQRRQLGVRLGRALELGLGIRLPRRVGESSGK